MLAVTDAERRRLEDALRRAGGMPERLRARPPVVVAPGASYGDAKCWPAERFAELIDRLDADDVPVVLVGAPGEQERIAAVRHRVRASPVVLDGVLDVGALKALLQGARALVGNDAGSRHVAAAFGVPSVIFFGPTAVAKTADNLARVEVLETEQDCRPCYRRTCPIDHRCLRSIDVATAWAATERARGAGENARSECVG